MPEDLPMDNSNKQPEAAKPVESAKEKAVQEATKAVRAGGSKEALAAAERRFMANKAAVKAIREALGNEEFQRLARAGIVASLSGMAQE